jgi:hypothetical protein
MPFDNDDQFNTMLAPYQAMAQRLNQPYPMLGGSGGVLARHPLLARTLNEGMLAGAFVPPPQGPEGAGAGISRALQGILGADQFERQRMIQTAMLPYQMMMPRLQAQDIMSQIAERKAMIPFRESQELRNMAYYDNVQSMEKARLNQKSITDDRFIDNNGTPWHGVIDPSHPRGYRVQNSATSQYLDELSPEEQKKVILKPDSSRQEGGRSLAERMVDADEAFAIKTGGKAFTAPERNERIVQYVAGMAGSAESARKGAAQPFFNETDTINREAKVKYEGMAEYNPAEKGNELIAKIGSISPTDRDIFPKDSVYGGKTYPEAQVIYKNAIAARDRDFANYAASTAPGQGIGYAEYALHRDQYPSKHLRSNLPAGDNRASAPNSVVEGSQSKPNMNFNPN